MYILLVEDDYLQSDLIASNLAQSLSDLTIRVISTESSFRSLFDEICRNPPDLVIMDVILRWSDPAAEILPPPEEVKTQGPYRAGFRCQQLLADYPPTRGIPVIMYSIIEATDVAQEIGDRSLNTVSYLAKGSDLSPLIEQIRRIKNPV